MAHSTLPATAMEVPTGLVTGGVDTHADSGLGPDEDGLGGVAGEPIDAVVIPVPKARTHWVNISRAMPRSSAMPINVAPGVDSYRSTAYRRKSSV